MKLPHGKRSLLTLIMALAAVIVVGVFAGSSVASSGKAHAKDTLVVLEDDIAPALDLDGANASAPGLQEILLNIMSPLLSYPNVKQGDVLAPQYKVSTAKFAPQLATSWSQKGLTWTFKLRKGVKSCSGNEFTADDVVYTFQRAKSVSGAAPVAWFLSNVGGVLGLEPLTSKDPAAKDLKGEVTKIDPYTVQIKQQHASELFPRVLEIFALFMFDSKETKAHATTKDPWAHTYVNTVNSPGFGPYCLTKWNKGSETDLTANPNGWYAGKPQYTKVIIRKVPANSNRVAAIQSGAADIVTNLTPQETTNVAKNSGVSVLSFSGAKILTLGLSFNFKPWNNATNRQLRQAVAYAIPYNDIFTSDYLGKARKWNGLCASSYYGFVSHPQYVTDIAKAKALMTSAGFPDGKGLETDGLKLTYVAERRALLEPIANRIKTALAAIGMNLTLDPISQSEYTDRTLTKYDVPMFLSDQDRPLGPDIGYCSMLFYVAKKNGGLNTPFAYDNPAFDALYKTSSVTVGAKRLAALAKMQDILMTDLPGIPVAEAQSQLVVRKGITGWVATNYDILSFQQFKSA